MTQIFRGWLNSIFTSCTEVSELWGAKPGSAEMTFLGVLTFLHNAREIARQRCTIFPFSYVIRQILVPTYRITEGSMVKIFRSLKNVCFATLLHFAYQVR